MQLPLPFSRARLALMFTLAASVGLSVLLVAGRVLLSGNLYFAFLLWNLILAIIPFVLSTMLDTARGPLRGRLLLPVGAVWLLFYPNAPYIITDLFHLEARAGVPLWYDLALIFSAAWNGLMLGYASLLTMQTLVQRRFGPAWSWAFVATALLLSSFGIYLGRYLRFNSWDVLTNPLTLFYDILSQFLNPGHHLRTWGITVVFGLFLLLGYATVRLLGRVEEPEA